MTTPLFSNIADDIQSNGPMTLHRYMALALAHPDHGYYQSQKAVGADGDFITAPEISQMFGELCGLWGLDQIITQNIEPIAGWMELGPGRGTLMSDIIRVCGTAMPNRTKPWSVHLLDINATLIKEQQKRLAPITDLHHHSDLTSLPEKPLVVLANEFFDALPIRQFIAQDGQWYERCVTLNEGALQLATHTQAEEDKTMLPDPAENGLIAEIAPDLPDIVTSIATHINTWGGAALIIDYGKDNAIGDSVQAVMEHKPVDILESPGLCDLSAWVDFSAIRHAAEAAGAKAMGPQSQGDFLKQLGLYQRAEQLAMTATSGERRKIAAAVDRLSSPAQMGGVFKAMAILPASHPATNMDELAGFAAV